MNKQTEALKMAIEALLTGNQYADAINSCKEALEQPVEVGDAEIKQMLNDIEWYQMRVKELEALEQPAQEPVKQKVKVLYEKDGIQTCEILPAPSWQGLSDDEIANLIRNKLLDKEQITIEDLLDLLLEQQNILERKNK